MSTNPYSAPATDLAQVPLPDQASKHGVSGLRGWLMLLGITLAFSLIFKITVICQNIQVMNGPAWSPLTTPGSAAYDPMWGPGIVAEILLLSVLIAINLYVLYLFLKKRATFVRWFIVFAASNAFIAIADYALCAQIHNFPENSRPALVTTIVQSLVYAAVWCLYVTKSVRVRNTFVREKAGPAADGQE